MTPLEQFKTHLAKEYEAVLGLKLRESVSGDLPEPLWLDKGGEAWMLDTEIGLALRVVPYEDPNQDLNEAVQGALRIATLLQPRFGVRPGDVDKHGIWQVAIIWLIDRAPLAEHWRKAIAAFRRESAFSEEVGLDAVLAEDGRDFGAACKRHGLPQLLLNVRRLLALSYTQMPAWVSANARVKEMLAGFPDRFAGDQETRRLASTLVADALGTFAQEHRTHEYLTGRQPAIWNLEEIEIRNFRNIGHCHMKFPKDKGRAAQAHIIFGPNGTGKTSIFEALCLAAGGRSRAWERYQGDADVEPRTRDYPSLVLSPLHGNEHPHVSVNGADIRFPSVEDDGTGARELEGSLLGQEDSHEFLGELGPGLAQRILQGYSTLADRATELASTRERSAREEKATWLRGHGLVASITRRETRAQRLIEGEIRKESWLPSQALITWLEKTSRVVPGVNGEGKGISARWRAWSDRQQTVVRDMATGALVGEVSLVRTPLHDWLGVRNALLADTGALVARASASLDSLRNRLSGVEKELDVWGEWLRQQASQRRKGTSADHLALTQEIDVARRGLKDLQASARVERQHAAHLRQVVVEFLSTWSQMNPNTCPTCGKDHSMTGGIEKAVRDLRSKTEERLGQVEREEKSLTGRINELEVRLASLGVAPISEERQKHLEDLSAPFLGELPLRSVLIDPSELAALKGGIRDVLVLPDVPTVIAPEVLEEVAHRLAERSLSLDAEAERLWPLPERWGKIVTTLRGECDRIVAQHLPETLQLVWREITEALAAARWNLVGRPTFQARGSGHVIVGLEERPTTPARYLFNQAERHIMGLGWFIVRYLTHGRFHRALIALDDPAQEMDQTTFRAFGRFVQTLLRLHQIRRIPLQMVCFLHQEDRALDLARATMGRFVMLTWQKSVLSSTRDNVWEVRLLSEGFGPQSAIPLLAETTAAR